MTRCKVCGAGVDEVEIWGDLCEACEDFLEVGAYGENDGLVHFIVGADQPWWRTACGQQYRGDWKGVFWKGGLGTPLRTTRCGSRDQVTCPACRSAENF